MHRSLDFGRHHHRCLFQNECVQAHLLGLTAACRRFEGCFKQPLTVVVTFGAACARLAGEERNLKAGDQIEVPHACPLHLSTADEADILLLLR